jgi:D-glycero-alpha-D-manno-heptose-7-phosphate kinase
MIITRAPLRVPLGGGGTDFPSYYLKYGGYILGFAIKKYVYVVLHNTIDSLIRLKYSKNEVVNDVDKLENRVATEALKTYGVTKGVEVATFSDVPESSGLGGSSSFCVALVTALRRKLGMSLDKYEIFQSAYNVERVKAEQPGGVQDQLFAALGGAWCTELGENMHLEMVDVSKLVPKLKLVYTNTHRTNLEIAEKQTGDVNLGNPVVLESLRKTKELGKEVEVCIRTNNLDRIGEMFNTHWENKKKRSNLISTPELDSIYEGALKNGATGGKLVGLGGGGYFLFYVPEKLEGFNAVDLEVDWEGAKVVYANG